MAPPLLTILTITGDRDPLPALEQSIANNRRDDIEWLVADNRSEAGLQPADLAGTPIRWISAPARDGNAALNRGAAAALGLIVLPLLAGDVLHTSAVSRLINEWRRIPNERKARYSGITAIASTDGEARPFKAEWADVEPTALRYGQKWTGEPLFTIRVELLRARPLPLPGDPLPPLSLLWRVAGRGFMTHAINSELATRELPEKRSARSRRYDALTILSHDTSHYRSHPQALRNAAIDYQIASSELNISLRRQFRELKEDAAKALWITSWWPGRRKARLAALNAETITEGVRTQRSRHPRTTLLVSSLDPPIAGLLAATAIGFNERHGNTRLISLDAGSLERELRDAGVAPVLLEPRQPWQIIRLLRELRALIAQDRPEVIVSAGTLPNLATLLLKPRHKARIVWTLTPTVERGFVDRIAQIAERLLARFVPAMVTANQIDFDLALEQGYAAKRLRCIPPAVDLERLRRDPDGRNAHRTAWRVNDRAPLIGTVARIDATSDHATFLRAAVLVSRERPEARFACIGGGPNARVADMQQMSRNLGLGDRITWTGPITISASVYSALDICVSTATSSHGVPEAIAEAMACGTPVIATDAGDSAWLLGDDRAIVPIGDAEALAARILETLADIDAGLSDPATLRARVARERSMGHVLDQMEELLYG
jgi:glycosyltransferase involved in cell wall biosynthesis